MTADEGSARSAAAAAALRPLWMASLGICAGAVATLRASWTGPALLAISLLALGCLAAAVAVAGRRHASAWLWLAAGVALGAGRGLTVRADELAVAGRLAAVPEAAVRARLTVTDGWSPATWGWRCQARLHQVEQRDLELHLPRRVTLEVREVGSPAELPPPGTPLEVLAFLRGDPERPLLVASSPRLLVTVGAPRGMARARQLLAGALLEAAGTDVGRIRAAELAAALSVGRRDLMAAERREGWRRSGFSHALSVSGLHVSLVGGTLWLAAVACHLRPRLARLLVMLALPAYALLAGAEPPALRAAVMGSAYMAARLIGRAVLPMAAVLLATSLLLLASPQLVFDVGFQLTVVITAALVRWVPPIAERLPGRWLAGTLAVPLVAQAASAPLLATHFRTSTPGALIANLAVAPILAPMLVLSLVATALAPVLPLLAAWCLDLLALCDRALWLCGAPGRLLEMPVSPLPLLATAAVVAAGVLGLQHGRVARFGAVAWMLLVAAGGLWTALRPSPSGPRVDLLPVADGLAATVRGEAGTVLVDGGRFRREARDLLAEVGQRRLEAVIASHHDDDHIGGLEAVVSSLRVKRLVVPWWLPREEAAVPLLRRARQRGVAVVPVARGSAADLGGIRLEVLWPPVAGAPAEGNRASLVARLLLPEGTVLITSDVDQEVERQLAATSRLACDLLLVPHHGSATSTSAELITAADPSVALVPAGPHNRNRHPHPTTLALLRATGLPFRYPARDGGCGATPLAGRWRPFP